MRRHLCGLILMATLFAPAARAQSAGPQEWRITPFGGVNFAKFGGDDVGDVNTRTAAVAGAYVVIPLGRFLALVPGAAYSQEGTSVDISNTVSGTFKLDYLEVPLLLRLSAPLAGSGDLRPYVVAGPGIGFELSCNIKASNGSQTVESDCGDPGLSIETKSVQFSGVFGGGIDIGRMTVGFRYQFGLSTIDDGSPSSDIKNRVLSLIAGYGFRLGH